MPLLSAGRVIAGSARGIRLVAPGEGTRPLGDRVKQTLFATLEGGSLGEWPVPFLDLFAGSGAAGIEALSRGSPRVVFVERDPSAVRTIRENLHRARLDGARGSDAEGPQVEVVQSDVMRFLAGAAMSAAESVGGGSPAESVGHPPIEPAASAPVESSRETTTGKAPFGAVLVDPPYEDAAMLPALERLGHAASRWVGEGSVVVAKHFWRDPLPPRIGSLELQRERRFGETMLTFYQAVGGR